MSPMRPAIVHHVAEEDFKQVRAPFRWRVGRADAEMPFADKRGVATGLFERLWEQLRARQLITPRIVRRLLPDHSRHPDPIRVTAGQQCRPRRRTDTAIGKEVLESHAFVKQPVHVPRADVPRPKRAVIAPPLVIGEDD